MQKFMVKKYTIDGTVRKQSQDVHDIDSLH